MSDPAVIAGQFRRSTDTVPVATARPLSGERLAVGLAAAGVAMLPLAVPTGPANAAPNDALIVVAIGACLLWAGTAGFSWRLPYIVPLGFFVAGGAIGALVGPVPGLGIVALIQDALLITWCWAVANVSRSPANLRVLLTTWAYSSIAWGVMPLIGIATGSKLLTGQTENQGTRVQITLADPSYAAGYFFISIMIIWAIGRPRSGGLRLAAYAVLLTGIVLTGSNSGAVSLIVGTVVAGSIGMYRRFGIMPAATALVVVVVSGFLVASRISLTDVQERAHSSRYAFIRDGIGRGTSFEQRGMLLRESIRLFRKGSVLGEGPVSTKRRLQDEMAPFQKEAHDDYLAALLERGAIGFVGVLLLVSGLGLRAVSFVNVKLAAGFASVVRRPNALVGAVAGTVVSMTVYEFLHVRHVWALFGLVAAVSMWGREWR